MLLNRLAVFWISYNVLTPSLCLSFCHIHSFITTLWFDYFIISHNYLSKVVTHLLRWFYHIIYQRKERSVGCAMCFLKEDWRVFFAISEQLTVVNIMTKSKYLFRNLHYELAIISLLFVMYCYTYQVMWCHLQSRLNSFVVKKIFVVDLPMHFGTRVGSTRNFCTFHKHFCIMHFLEGPLAPHQLFQPLRPLCLVCNGYTKTSSPLSIH